MAAILRYLGWALFGLLVAWLLFVYFPGLLARISPTFPRASSASRTAGSMPWAVFCWLWG